MHKQLLQNFISNSRKESVFDGYDLNSYDYFSKTHLTAILCINTKLKKREKQITKCKLDKQLFQNFINKLFLSCLKKIKEENTVVSKKEILKNKRGKQSS